MAGDLILNVFISNPERKKERTDADANDREVYVAGLSKFVTKEDLEKLFKTVSGILSISYLALFTHLHLYEQYGPLKEVRMTTDQNGHSKGFAFVEFVNEVRKPQNRLPYIRNRWVPFLAGCKDGSFSKQPRTQTKKDSSDFGRYSGEKQESKWPVRERIG